MTSHTASLALDTCRGKESEIQTSLASLETEKMNLVDDKNEQCSLQNSLATKEFAMPVSKHGSKTCNFATHKANACWEHAYLSALEALEGELETAEEQWKAAKDSCKDLTSKVADKVLEIDQKETVLNAKKSECDKKEQNKVTAYCKFQDKVSDLCDASETLATLWNALKAEKDKKRVAIRTMKIVSCLLTDSYQLGNAGCAGCQLGSATTCETKLPATASYGVDTTEPAILTAKTGFFGLPQSSAAAPAWCNAALGSADVNFPGHLWTRDAAGKLTRATSSETTTITAMCTTSTY